MSADKLRKIAASIRAAHRMGQTYHVPGEGWPHQRMAQRYKRFELMPGVDIDAIYRKRSRLG